MLHCWLLHCFKEHFNIFFIVIPYFESYYRLSQNYAGILPILRFSYLWSKSMRNNFSISQFMTISVQKHSLFLSFSSCPHSITYKQNFFCYSRKKTRQWLQKKNVDLQLKYLIKNDKPVPTGRSYQGESRFTRQQIESGSAPLAVLVALEVILIIVVILRDETLVPIIVADISRNKIVAGWTPLSGLSHAGPMIVTEEDRRRRRRRQLRALKATLKVTGQKRLYRVCLRRAWKTERETRSRDQSTTSSRFYDIPLSPYIRILTLCLFPLVSSRLDFSPSISPSSYSFFLSYHQFSPIFLWCYSARISLSRVWRQKTSGLDSGLSFVEGSFFLCHVRDASRVHPRASVKICAIHALMRRVRRWVIIPSAR